MKLLIVGHTAHFKKQGQIVGWGPTVREIDWLARAFDSVIHLACLHPGNPPSSAVPYESDRIHFVGVPPAGGLTLRSKFRAVLIAPYYIQSILKQLPKADVIQIRTPGILGLYGLLLVSLFSNQPRWVKYAGNWMETGSTPLSFRIQRGWLARGLSRGPVVINGHWPDQRNFIFSFLNPSLNLPEIHQAKQNTASKQLTYPIKLVFAGRLEANKRPMTAIEVVRKLREHIPIHLDIFGDGPERPRCQKKVTEYNLQEQICFHGWTTQDAVKTYLCQAHFILHPSLSEGWPKILSEGMAFGAVPVASNISSIPQVLNEFQCGFALPPSEPDAFTEAILETCSNPQQWKQLSLAGQAAAPRFTYEKYLVELDRMFKQYYQFSPMNQQYIEILRDKFKETIT